MLLELLQTKSIISWDKVKKLILLIFVFFSQEMRF